MAIVVGIGANLRMEIMERDGTPSRLKHQMSGGEVGFDPEKTAVSDFAPATGLGKCKDEDERVMLRKFGSLVKVARLG